MEYEIDYHKKLHQGLYNPDIYLIRSKLSFFDYGLYRFTDKGKTLLEYGCGLGQNLKHLPWGLVEGYDVSQHALDFCDKQSIRTINSLKGKKNSYDVVFSRHVLEHLTNPYDELKKIRDVLKKDGILYLVIPYERLKKTNLGPHKSRHLYAWNLQTINNLLYETGFKVLKNEVKYERGGFNKLYKPLWKGVDSEWLYTLGTKLVGVITNSRELIIIARKNGI